MEKNLTDAFGNMALAQKAIDEGALRDFVDKAEHTKHLTLAIIDLQHHLKESGKPSSLQDVANFVNSEDFSSSIIEISQGVVSKDQIKIATDLNTMLDRMIAEENAPIPESKPQQPAPNNTSISTVIPGLKPSF